MDNMSKRVFILIPAFNEEESLEKLVHSVSMESKKNEWDYKIIICDDGSTDKTPLIAKDLTEKYPIEVITHKINRGLGETERDLFERAAELSKNEDIILRVEGDNTHDPSYMTHLVNKLDDGYDVVVASRFADGGGAEGLNAQKTFISLCANKFMKFFFPIKNLKEYSCGFRAYRAGIVRKAIKFYGNDFIQLKGMGFTCTLEVLVKLKILQARFAEVPFTLHYDRKFSASKMVTSITTLGYIVMTIMHHWPWGGWRTSYKRELEKKSGV